ncbi:SLC13 family permease [Cardiobacterium hominis]|uniref:SLC13 family permease n=1 Tax=Cardiobacterium hominis TaxID=2718 RepID=UPI00249362EA|nr:SLC13 family permease [Cardiobacterium hominis]
MDWIVLLTLPLLLLTLASGRVAPAVAFFTVAAAFMLGGIVSTEAFLTSFSNPALATLVVLLLVSAVIERSPLLHRLSNKILVGDEKHAFIRLTGISTLLSAFMNNTAVVSTFLVTLTRQQKIPPSRLLIPLSYASILGGITTLIGTSTNLVVNSFVESAGLPPLRMFQFSAVGIPVALACLVVLYWRMRVLPANSNSSQDIKNTYFLTVEVLAEADIAGKSVAESGLKRLDDLYLVEIQRDNYLISPVRPEVRIRPGDQLIFSGSIEHIGGLQAFRGLKILGEHASDLLASNLVEAVIAHESDLVYKTLQEIDFRGRFNAGVVGIRRGNKRLTGRLGHTILHVGDSLILAVGSHFAVQADLEKHFHILSTSYTPPRLTNRQGNRAIAGFILAVLLETLNLLPLLHGLLLLLGVYLLAGYTSIGELRRRIPFELIAIIGSAIAIAKGMDNTGAAQLIGTFMQHVFHDKSVFIAFAGIYFMTLITTEIITNNAAAALAIPIALSTAQALNADPLPFVMAVAYGASACFILPFGYQTHLMVYTPGRYTLRDYLRTGVPVSLTYSALVLLLTPLVFPF